MSVDSFGPDVPAGFSITVRTLGPDQPDVSIVECAGELDLSTCPQLGDAIAKTSTGDVIADLTDVTFMDSSGVAVLVSCVRELDEAGRQFVVVCPPGAPRRVLALTNLEELLRTYDTHDEAVAALRLEQD